MKVKSMLQCIRENGIDETFYGYLHSVYSPKDQTYRVKVLAPTFELESPFQHAVQSALKISEAARQAGKLLFFVYEWRRGQRSNGASVSSGKGRFSGADCKI